MIYVATHAGKGHAESEDAVLVGKNVLSETAGTFPVPRRGFVCVADGVGGNRGGAQAARFVLRALANREESGGAALKPFLEEVNDALLAAAQREGDAPDMATTLTGLYFADSGWKLPSCSAPILSAWARGSS